MSKNFLMKVTPLFVTFNGKKYGADYFAEYISDKTEFGFIGYTLYLEEDNLFTTKIKLDDEFCKIFFEALVLNKNKDNKECKQKPVLDLHLSYYRINTGKDFIKEVEEVVKARVICFEHNSDGDDYLTIDFKI